VRIIARLLGVPKDIWPDLLRWSNAMVAMYQVGRNRTVEDAANTAAADFSAFLRGYVDLRRDDPRADLALHPAVKCGPRGDGARAWQWRGLPAAPSRAPRRFQHDQHRRHSRGNLAL
jgi:hypothetical protein